MTMVNRVDDYDGSHDVDDGDGSNSIFLISLIPSDYKQVGKHINSGGRSRRRQ